MKTQELMDKVYKKVIDGEEVIYQDYKNGSLTFEEYKCKYFELNINALTAFLDEIKENNDKQAEIAKLKIPLIIARYEEILKHYKDE